jgi:hypothetical protein
MAGKRSAGIWPLYKNPFLDSLEIELEKSMIHISPFDLQDLLKMEIEYYASARPQGNSDPRVAFAVDAFFHGLIQNGQGFTASEYVPFTSYWQNSFRNHQVNLGHLNPSKVQTRKAVYQIHFKKVEQDEEEPILNYLLEKYGYRRLSEKLLRTISKNKSLLGLSWPQLERKYEVSRGTVTKVNKDDD